MRRRSLAAAILGALILRSDVAGLPGSTPSLIPPSEDETQRRLRDLERRMDELGPSVARSFAPVVAALVQPESQTHVIPFGFPLTTTQATVSTISFTVPAGYTRAAFVYNMMVQGTNGSGAAASITLYPAVAWDSSSNLYPAYPGPTLPTATVCVTSCTVADTISGLIPGHTVTFSLDAQASSNTFGSSNQGTGGVLVLWMK